MGNKKEITIQSLQELVGDSKLYTTCEICKEEHKDLTVDIVIPTYKPDHKFDLLMERLRKQTVQPNNIFIINTIPASCDHEQGRKEQEERMKKYHEKYHATIVHISQDEFDHGATRAYGASLSDADLIMFMTQDAVPVDEFLIEELRGAFSNSNVAAAYGRQLALSNADEIETFTRVFNYPGQSRIKSKEDFKSLGIKTYFCSNVCSMYRKSTFDVYGGFVKKTIFNEDMIFAAKLIENDFQIAYVAEAKVFHSHHYTYMQQFRRNFDLGVSHAEYPEVFLKVKSESEGIKLVKKNAKYLIDRHSYIKLIDLFFVSGFKYLGYWFGVRYRKFPKKLVVKWSMNKNYWK